MEREEQICQRGRETEDEEERDEEMERRETGVVNGGKSYRGDVLYFYAMFFFFTRGVGFLLFCLIAYDCIHLPSLFTKSHTQPRVYTSGS